MCRSINHISAHVLTALPLAVMHGVHTDLSRLQLHDVLQSAMRAETAQPACQETPQVMSCVLHPCMHDSQCSHQALHDHASLQRPMPMTAEYAGCMATPASWT